MKRLIILILCFLLLASAVQAAEPFGGKRNYMTFSLGGYWPSGDLDDEGYKAGPDFNFSYMRSIQTWFGFGAGAHTYGAGSNSTAATIGDGDFGSLGIEMMFYVQPNHWQIQPYFGIGPAIYYNYLEFESDLNEDRADESGVGLGWVFKLGLRAFLTERFFGGMSLKGFSDYWDLEVESGRDETYDFGGGVLAFELGFTF
jgi:opacity protein-like surface antigen